MKEKSCDLTRCFLCTHCIPEWKEVIAVKKSTMIFKKGKPIFSEEDPVQGIFFLYEGFVKVHMQWGEQKELILRFAKAGDILGHRGLGGNTLYPISATALDDTKVCYISNDFLEATLRTNPSFTYALMQIYSAELQKAEKRMRDLAHMEVKGRIALALLEIANIFGTDTEKYITVPILRQDIAYYAGTTYETVFKLLTEFIARNIISISGKSIRINDSDVLKRFVTYHI